MFSMHQAMQEGVQSFRAVSTGNHATAVLKAAELLKPASVEIVVPHNISPVKLKKMEAFLPRLKSQGIRARIRIIGDNFDAANRWCEARRDPSILLLHPYRSPNTVAGQSTIGTELAHQLKPLLAKQPQITDISVIGAVAGGGLMSGTALGLTTALKTDPKTQAIRTHFLGLQLENIASPLGDAIRVKHPARENAALMRQLGVSLKRLPDHAIQAGLDALVESRQIVTEGASGMSIYPVLQWPAWQPSPSHLVISLISGSNR
jgi:threonine dehydratase